MSASVRLTIRALTYAMKCGSPTYPLPPLSLSALAFPIKDPGERSGKRGRDGEEGRGRGRGGGGGGGGRSCEGGL